MAGFTPLRPTGSTTEALFDQAAWDKLHGPAGKLVNSSTIKWDLTTRGIRAHAKPPRSSGTFIGSYKIQSHQGDYVTCHSWDGTTEGSTDVLIAKPRNLFFSIASETLRGDAITYSAYDTTDQSRTATLSTVDYFEVIDRMYYAGDIIEAATMVTGVTVSGVKLTLGDLNRDGRSWLRKP